MITFHTINRTSSAERFGYEWDIYDRMDPHRQQYEEQFLNWVWPLSARDFEGRVVLDAGCGMGRNSYWCAQWEAQEVVAFDNDERTVAAARRNLNRFSTVHVERRSIYDLPWENRFDIAMAIGVIHHLTYPQQAVAALHTAVKPGGQVILWVYSVVGYERLLSVLNPVRERVTSRLPASLLHRLAYVVSVPFYGWLMVGRPQRRYFQQLRQFSFRHVHSILFDQLLPRVPRYYDEAGARALMSGFKDVTITVPPNGNGWIVRGVKG